MISAGWCIAVLRSEEYVRRWCADRGARPGAMVTLGQMWALTQRQAILDAVGFSRAVWSLPP
jgi:hypothetical protein